MGGSALANAEAMTCLRGAGRWARPCGVIELTCAALRWPAADAGRWGGELAVQPVDEQRPDQGRAYAAADLAGRS
jgi:hypothetical protein